MSLLQIVQDVCNVVGVAAPTSVIGNTDQDIQTLLQLANTEGKLLADSYDWQALETPTTITTLAQEDQGAVGTLAPGFKKLIPETMWIQDNKFRVDGSLNAQDWQRITTMTYSGPYPNFRIRAGRVLMYPIPAAGMTVRFEYISKNWILAADNTTTYARWTNDTDAGLLDEDLMTLGLRWRWLKAKNFDYAEEFRDYEVMKANMQGRDAGKMTKNLGGRMVPSGPFVPLFPEGSWTNLV
jgi:hypothetical protein